jgi:hypothetical protein
LIEEIRKGHPCRPGQKERYDYEYKRNGVRNLNMFYEPLAGKRYVRITEHHTMIDLAQGMKWLVDVLYPNVILITESMRLFIGNSGLKTLASN